MNGRLLLLVLFTGLFMAVWNGDQAAMEIALAKRAQAQEAQLASADVSIDATESHSEPKMLLASSRIESVAEPKETPKARVTDVPVVSASQAGVPLPNGITNGIYQAVDQTGRTIKVMVEGKPTDRPRDFYVADAKNGDRWYLIRVIQ